MSNPAPVDASAVRRHLLHDRPEVITRIADCADDVAEALSTTRSGGATTDENGRGSEHGGTTGRIEDNGDRDLRLRAGGPVRHLLESTLAERGLIDELASVLEECLVVSGASTSVDPVPAPPYVVVTSRGPALRATLSECRLLVRFDVFTLEEGSLVRTGRDPASVVSVALR